MLTMTLEPIIVASGGCPDNYPVAKDNIIILFDEDDNIVSDQDIKFAKPLFEENPSELTNFLKFIAHLNDSLQKTSVINIMIDEFSVVFFYKTKHPITFVRKHILQPHDYS